MSSNKANTQPFKYVLLALMVVSLFVNIIISVSASPMDGDSNKFLFYNLYFLSFLIAVYLFASGINKHFLIVAFFVCFFIFLMGQKFFVVAEGGDFDTFLTFAYLKLSPHEYVTFANCLYFSIFSCFVGYLLIKKKERRTVNIEPTAEQKNYLRRMRKVIRVLYWIFFVCAALMQLQILSAKSGMDYTDGYLINVDVNPILKIGNYLYLGTAFALLASKPSKGETVLTLLSFGFVEGFLQMLLGRRALIAQFILFAVWYLISVSGFDKKKFRLKHLIILIVFGLIMIGVFYIVEVLRGGGSVTPSSLGDIIKKFFISTGGSDSAIANTIHYENDFPKVGVVYLLSPIKTALFENALVLSLVGFLTGVSVTSPTQGLGYLERFDSLDHWLSYIVNPELYVNGYGMGSSYIAEVYFALGIFGIIIFGLLLGMFIAKLSSTNMKGTKIYKKAFAMFFIYNLFTLPRSGAFSWATQLLYFAAALLIIKFVSALVLGNKKPIAYGNKKYE